MLRAAVDDLRITTAELGERAYVTAVAGELDLAHTEELEYALNAVLAHGAPRLIVDLCGVPLIDSAALGVLTSTAKRLRSAGGTFILVSDDPRVLRTLAITGLDRFFAVERSLTEAVARVIEPPEWS